MKFLVVDDHVLIREALRNDLRELDSDAIVLEASRWLDATRLIDENLDLSLVLLDLGLPDCDGFLALEEVRAHHSHIPVVILSGSCDRNNVTKALDLGAAGFIPKSGEREVMLIALRLVFSGGVYIPPEILPHSEASKTPEPPTVFGPLANRPSSPGELALTPRQVEVLALMMRGKSNKAICRVLDLAEPTVKNHVTAILKALGASNRTEVVITVNALGWDLPKVGE